MRIILEQNRALLWNCVSNKEVSSIKCRRALPSFISTIKHMNINEMLSWLPRCCRRHGYRSVGNKMAADVNSTSTFDSTSRLLSNLHSDRERSLARSSIGNCTDLSLVWPPLSSITIIAEDLSSADSSLASSDRYIKFKNGNIYKGTISDGLLHGKGQYVWTDGTVYEGDFVMNSITGTGTYRWPDGTSYEGEVKEGYRHGYGVFRRNQTTYTGQWVRGKRHGKGRLDYGSGSYYDGEWCNDTENGIGTRQYSSGNVYEGTWRNRLRHGHGTMHWKEEGERYTGEWVNGIQDGKGEHVWIISHNDKSQYPVYNRYVGDWKNGIREGWGVFHYACGGQFEGVWIDKKNGKGKYTSPNGEVIEGVYQDDKLVTAVARPDTPLGSAIGDIDGEERGQTTEQFKLCLSSLNPSIDINKEMKQVHGVILRYLTQLRRIYHKYSTLGANTNASDCGEMLNRIQLWQFLRDCQLYRHKLTIVHIEEIIQPCKGGKASGTGLNIYDKFLMREFLQCLFFISYHIYYDSQRNFNLSKCFDLFMKNDCLPRACKIQGRYFNDNNNATIDRYITQLWDIFQRNSINNQPPTLRKLLFIVKGWSHSVTLDAKSIVEGIVELQPLAVAATDEPVTNRPATDQLDMDIPIIFLEFLEAITHFSFIWHLAAIEGKRKEEETPPSDELKEQVEKGYLSYGNRCILIKKDEQEAVIEQYIKQRLH